LVIHEISNRKWSSPKLQVAGPDHCAAGLWTTYAARRLSLRTPVSNSNLKQDSMLL
jgi:hypothetical protein